MEECLNILFFLLQHFYMLHGKTILTTKIDFIELNLTQVLNKWVAYWYYFLTSDIFLECL